MTILAKRKAGAKQQYPPFKKYYQFKHNEEL